MADLQDFSAAALKHAIDDNLIEKSLCFPRLLGGEIHGPNPLWFITGSALPQSNGVVSAAFASGQIDEGVAAALQPFKARNLPATWWVGPQTSPGNLGIFLQNHGLRHDRDMIGMAMDLDKLHMPPAAAPELTLARVQDAGALRRWYTLLLQGFPISFDQAYLDALAAASLDPAAPWQHYVAWLDGEIVSISSLFLGAGVAGLYNLVTAPALRGQGVGAWMTVRTLHLARAAGYRVGALQTTYPNALRLYHRLGLEVYCKIGVYRYTPAKAN